MDESALAIGLEHGLAGAGFPPVSITGGIFVSLWVIFETNRGASSSREDAAASVATWTSINATGANLSLDGKNSDELGSIHPAGSTGQKPNSYFYYYTDEMWYVNPTSYVGTLGFICIALVLHIIVCTIRQKPSSSAPPALVAASSDNALSGEVIPEDAPPPAYSLLYGCLPPPPDYETASKLWQPPPNYKELQPPAPVHRALLS